MASLICPDCGSQVPWTAAGCAGCGAAFHEIRCVACNYAGPRDRFGDQRCPKCNKNQFKIVPQLGRGVDEVGAEAFVDEAPLLNDIERSFSKAKSRRAATPPNVSPPSPPSKDSDADPRPVLTRQKWTVPKVSKEARAPQEKPVEAKAGKRSIKQQPVAATIRRRYTIELPPKVQQILRWSALIVPAVLVLVAGILLLLSGRSNRPARPRGADMTTMVDPGALEAQAMALYNAAVEYYRAGKTEESVTALQQVVSLFPLTNGGTQARHALDRVVQGRAPFDERPPTPESPSPPAQQVAQAPPAETPKKKPFIGIRPSLGPGETTKPDSPGDSKAPQTPAKAPEAPPQGSTLAKTNTTPRALPDGFVAVAEAGVDSSGWPIEILCLKDQSHMMLVPAGEFEMGNEHGASNVRPLHRVRLKAFYIDRYEITLTHYKHFLEQRRLKGNPYRELSAAAQAAGPSDRHPVVGVAWRDANAYAEWSGKTLPTEAQWEKAARGSDGRLFPWGSGSPKWEQAREPKQLDRVGSFAWDVSVYGCFDMAGNAWEWCSDWYDPNIYNRASAEDPEGPKTAPPPVSARDPEKVIRGGSPDWEVTWRGFAGIQDEPLAVGFRCALEVERLAPRAPSGNVVTELPRQTQPQAPARIPPGGYKF